MCLLVIRLCCYMHYQRDHYFEPETSHMSYPFSFFASFAMLTSFRQPVLNAIPFLSIPSFFFTIPLWDALYLKNPSKHHPMEVLNALTIHLCPCMIGLWIMINRKELLSMEAAWNAFCFGLTYYLIVDDKYNNIGITGNVYMMLVFGLAFLWLSFSSKFLLNDSEMQSPFLSRLVVLEW